MAADFTLELAPEPEATRIARNEVGDRLAQRLDGRLHDAELLISELIANAIKHGSPDRHGRITLEVTLEPGTVRFEVTDAGRGFRSSPRPDAQDPASGWGLYLVDRIADRWGASREAGHTRVWFELDA